MIPTAPVLAFIYFILATPFLVWAFFYWQKIQRERVNIEWLDAIDEKFKALNSEINVLKVKVGLER